MMKLSLACGDYDRVRLISTGEIRLDGVMIDHKRIAMPESGLRMLASREFDLAEMSLSWFVQSWLAGDGLVGMPVFLSRAFRYGAIYVRSDSPLHRVEDLAGRRVGCADISTTTVIWLRGILADYHGIGTEMISYVSCDGRELDGIGSRLITDPGASRLPDGDGSPSALFDMLMDGSVDAVISVAPLEPRRRAGAVRRLYSNTEEMDCTYFERSGIFPIMHLLVMSSELAAREPWLAESLVIAFDKARADAIANLSATSAYSVMLPWLPVHAEVTEQRLKKMSTWPYGVPANIDTLRTFLRYLREQEMIDHAVEPAELFPEGVRKLLPVSEVSTAEYGHHKK